MNSPRRRAREMALKALYQAEMMKNEKEASLNTVLSDSFYMPIFDALAREFLKGTTIAQILAGEVEDFVSDFACKLSAAPISEPEEAIPSMVMTVLEARFPGVTCNVNAKKDLEDFCAKTLEKYNKNLPVETFARELVLSSAAKRAEADGLIEKYAKNWALDRMSLIDKCILRIAISEFLDFEKIPVKATINEAIELAKKYSADKSYEFINGILDRIAKENKMSKTNVKNESSEKNVEAVQAAVSESEPETK